MKLYLLDERKKYDKKSQGYCVGNVIFGNEIAVVDESNMTITKLKITDTANVYDYR